MVYRLFIQVLTAHPLVTKRPFQLILFVHNFLFVLRCTSHRTIQVTCKANVDVDQLRRDLREVFDEFIMHANAVVDRHIERL